MSHLLLAPSRSDVFNSAASPSFDLPSPYLSIETSHGAPAPLLFLNTLHFCSSSSILPVFTSHYCIWCACSAGQIKRITRQYLRSILSFLSTHPFLGLDNSTLDILVRPIPPLDRTFYLRHPHSTHPLLERARTPLLLLINPLLDTFAPHLRQDGSNAATLCATSVSRPWKEYIP